MSDIIRQLLSMSPQAWGNQLPPPEPFRMWPAGYPEMDLRWHDNSQFIDAAHKDYVRRMMDFGVPFEEAMHIAITKRQAAGTIPQGAYKGRAQNGLPVQRKRL